MLFLSSKAVRADWSDAGADGCVIGGGLISFGISALDSHVEIDIHNVTGHVFSSTSILNL
ncbi:hypothetical protein [Endozoicomonas elysicola]|uniref:hypothetical protein n=1 Tax=Endozoicomonas elysicola TaxID=305900 RepID=UPI00039A1E36|nr:hypothetical protein [Endozoicomonas elysicola]